ncbi:MAG: hypothetical protein LBL66_07220 [Clostridiales bacterium]|jgi:hypothetical protein|nr:hypothetical protein [Clostridiales bacterium]
MKHKFLFPILTLCLFALFAAGGCADKNEKYIRALNENFNGEFQFATAVPENESLGGGFIYEPGFGCYTLNSADGLTNYTVSGYPDCLDGYKVTSFHTEDGKYKLFGFSVGDTRESAEAALTAQGYTAREQDLYVLGKIRFTLFGQENIESISVRLETTNKQGVDF